MKLVNRVRILIIIFFFFNKFQGPILGRLGSAKAGPLGCQKDFGRRLRKRGEQMPLMKKAARTHLTVATLITTATFAAGFTLPSVHDEDKGNDHQGVSILALPPHGSKDRRRWDPSDEVLPFPLLIVTDMLALFLSSSAVLSYFLMASSHNVEVVRKRLFMGFLFTYSGLVAMMFAFL